MTGRRALFLDRDGIINEDRGYVHRVEDFIFLEPIFEICRCMSDADFHLVVVTNQSGIARGYFDEAAFASLTQWMLEAFQDRDIEIAGVFHCPYHPEGVVEGLNRTSELRKPEPGMLLQAQGELDLDLAASVLLGDSERDVEAARRAGVPCRLLVAGDDDVHATAATCVVGSLREALDWLQGALKDGRL